MGIHGLSMAVCGHTPHFLWAGVLCKVDTQASLKRDFYHLTSEHDAIQHGSAPVPSARAMTSVQRCLYWAQLGADLNRPVEKQVQTL